MFRTCARKGTSLVEWIVVIVLAITVVGTIVYLVMTAGAGQGSAIQQWLDSINAPAAVP
jgi:hypothetical protein